jgi:acetyl esterase/lipase
VGVVREVTVPGADGEIPVRSYSPEGCRQRACGGEQLAGLPSTLVLSDERDVLRSPGEDFARNLQASGVWVKAVRSEDAMHDFLGAAAVLDKAETTPLDAGAHLTKALTAVGASIRARHTRGPRRGMPALDAGSHDISS